VASSTFELVQFCGSVKYCFSSYDLALMTWIKTMPLSEANQQLLQALESQRSLYPVQLDLVSTDNARNPVHRVGMIKLAQHLWR
jgi:hypothetical protein